MFDVLGKVVTKLQSVDILVSKTLCTARFYDQIIYLTALTNVKNFYQKSDYQDSDDCGVEFKYLPGIKLANISSFLDHIKPISCENATILLSYDNKTSSYVAILDGLNINLSPDEVDVAHVGLVGFVAILILSNIICCLCCLCKKKESNRV